jgi:hypothetical protein
MGKTKTFQDYEADIRTYHAAGDFEKAHHRASKWSELVPLTFMIANNEQLPYTEELIELGHDVEGMPPKSVLGFQQTGDYLCYLPDYNRYTGVLWDRKSKNDAYGTLVHGQDRFFRECDRACENPLFDYLLIGVECTRAKLLSYCPNGQKGASPASRHGIIEALPPRFKYQVQFRWNGSRKYAVNDLIKQNRYWLKYNYAKVLGLE